MERIEVSSKEKGGTKIRRKGLFRGRKKNLPKQEGVSILWKDGFFVYVGAGAILFS